MLEIAIIMVLLYGANWLCTLICAFGGSKMMSRVIQISHSYYMVVFITIYFFERFHTFPLHFLIFIHLFTAIYFAYRWNSIPVNASEDELTELGKTIKKVFQSDHSNPQNQ